MSNPSAPGNALLTDLYELTMLQAYRAEGMDGTAVFSLFVRRLPESRNFLLACGLEQVLEHLEALRFDEEACRALAELGGFPSDFVAWLGELRFRGEVRAVPEGTPVFAGEPLLEVAAPIAEAQLVESFVMNQIHVQTVLASKAARLAAAAGSRPVVDFGMRRMHGSDAAMVAARAFHVAGLAGTSNVAAAARWGIPALGTMAHSYVEAHDDEMEAFRAFAVTHPETVLLVDTYDTIGGVRKVVELARELGEDFAVRGVRLDSGDLGALAKEARRVLDAAGLERVEIFASGGLDEHEIARLLAEGAPIDGFGVGTSLGVSADAPSLDLAYKLTEYDGRGRMKLSSGKSSLPGRQQVFREERDGVAVRDRIGRHDEDLPGRPLLRTVMRDGRRLDGASPGLEEVREHAASEMARLPERLRRLRPVQPPHPVEVSEALQDDRRRLEATLRPLQRR